MNLCGTSATAEPELLMKKSFDTGNANTRGSNSPAMTPKRVFHGDSLMDQTPASVLSASTPNSSNTPLLNPLSANLKATSSLVSKLETGYHLKQLLETRDDVQMSETVFLRLDANATSRPVLRITHNNNDDENKGKGGGEPRLGEKEGSNGISSEISIPLEDISQLEVGIQKSSMGLMNMKGIHPIRCFAVVMEEREGKVEEYHFEASSMNERDSIVSAIQELILLSSQGVDSGLSIDANTTLSPMKRTHIHSGTAAALNNATNPASTTPKTPFEQGTETSLAAFSFDHVQSADSNDNEHDSGTSGGNIALPSLNDVVDGTASPPTLSQRTTSADLPADVLMPSRSRTLSDIKESTLVDTESDSTQSCSEAGVPREHRNENDKQGMVAKEDEREVTGSPQNLATHHYSGNNSQEINTEFALSTEVHDVDGAGLTAGDPGVSVINPWCTDDLCSAALNDFWAGIFGPAPQQDNKGSREGVVAENYGILSGPAAVANFLSTGDVNEQVQPPTETPRFANRIQSQASKQRNQLSRAQQLRAKMTFEADQTQDKMQFKQTVNSFDDAERTGRKSEYQFDMTSSTGHFDMFGVGNLFALSEPDEPVQDETLYYDSDPEHYRTSRLRKGPRRVGTDEEATEAVKSAKKTRRRVLSGIPLEQLGFEQRPNRMDERITGEVIEAMKNEKMTLMWHPTQSKEAPNRSPVCVKVWIESGVYLIDGSFLLPKLTWIPLHEGDLQTKILNVGKQDPEKLDLLDVCRVRECTSVDRKQHPFARADRSFLIHTPDEVFLFEAQCTEERSRIVNGLKLVIARLASLLMMRDVRAVDEFFGGGAVPGEAPTWAQEQKNNTGESPAFP